MSRAQGLPAGLGIEDELSFGSDEDLLADVGEIPLQVAPQVHQRATSAASKDKDKDKKASRFKLASGSGAKRDKDKDSHKDLLKTYEKEKRKRTGTEETLRLQGDKGEKSHKHLAKSALIIDPDLQSVLDLPSAETSANARRSSLGSSSLTGSAGSVHSHRGGIGGGGGGDGASTFSLLSGSNGGGYPKDMGIGKKKGIMSAWRGFSKSRKEDLGVSNRLAQIKSRDSLARSDLSRQQSYDYASSTFSSPRTDTSSLPSHHQQLAPLAMSPFQAHPPELSHTPGSTIHSHAPSTISHTSMSSFAKRASIITSTSTDDDQLLDLSKLMLHGEAEPTTAGSAIQSVETRPKLSSRSTTTLHTAASPNSPSVVDFTSVLLPSFPASLSALASIQILSATVIRRVVNQPEREKNSSIRNLTSVLATNNNGLGTGVNPSGTSAKRPLWITQQLVLTSFKVGGGTPQSSPNSSEVDDASATSRTIAHLHLFNVPGTEPISSSARSSPSKGSVIGLGIGSVPSAPRRAGTPQDMEVERQVLTEDAIATSWDSEEGKRKYVLRVVFGKVPEQGEWVVEMRNADQLQEWIRQIDITARAIRSESLDRVRSHRSPVRRANGDSRYPGQSDLRLIGLNLAYDDPRGHLDRMPSAARSESPDMLGGALDRPAELEPSHEHREKGELGYEAEHELEHEHDPEFARRRRISLSASVHPTRYVPATPPPGSTRPAAVGAHLAVGGTPGSVRRSGRTAPAPPPSAPPPNAPLPALPLPPPVLSAAIATVHSPARGREVGRDVPLAYALPQRSPSTPNLKTQLSPALLPLPMSSSAQATTVIPVTDHEVRVAANKARKERLANAFRPIPLAPELETSPAVPQPATMSSPDPDQGQSPSPNQTFVPPPTPPRKRTPPELVSGPQRIDAGKIQLGAASTPPRARTVPDWTTPPGLPSSHSHAGTLDTVLDTPTTASVDHHAMHLGIGTDGKRYASSISSLPSTGSGGTSGRRRRERKVAVDIMSEFSETPNAAYAVEGEDDIIEDRPRVIRFA
ncbi:hypothetical protein IAU60_001175 [Kwoniella sp. DSM 27419]